MFCDAPAPQSISYPPPSAFGVGRSYSSSASSVMSARTGFLVGATQKKIDNWSIESTIGAIFDQNLISGVTGFYKKSPNLIITVDGNSAKLDRSIISIVQPNVAAEEAIPAISFKVQLETVQENLGLSITQVAQLFGVTRKAVYDWLDGSEPRTNIANRMELITSIIEKNNSNLNLKRLKGVWLTAVDGKSFIDILSDETIDEASRLAAASAKLEALTPRLGQESLKLGKTYLGSAHVSDIDRVADLG